MRCYRIFTKEFTNYSILSKIPSLALTPLASHPFTPLVCPKSPENHGYTSPLISSFFRIFSYYSSFFRIESRASLGPRRIKASSSFKTYVPVKINSANPIIVARAGDRTMDFKIPMAQLIAKRFGKRRKPCNYADVDSSSFSKTKPFNQI